MAATKLVSIGVMTNPENCLKNILVASFEKNRNPLSKSKYARLTDTSGKKIAHIFGNTIIEAKARIAKIDAVIPRSPV